MNLVRNIPVDIFIHADFSFCSSFEIDQLERDWAVNPSKPLSLLMCTIRMYLLWCFQLLWFPFASMPLALSGIISIKLSENHLNSTLIVYKVICHCCTSVAANSSLLMIFANRLWRERRNELISPYFTSFGALNNKLVNLFTITIETKRPEEYWRMTQA